VVAELLVVGGGNMGTALLRGLISSGWVPESLAVSDSDASTRDRLCEALPGLDVRESPVAAKGAVLAVKPADAESACRALSSSPIPRVLSVMAGVRTTLLEAWMPDKVVVRAMPNTPALLGEGASALSAGSRSQESDLRWAEEILGAVGIVVRVPDASLDAVTGLSGSGPAYLFYLAEGLIEAGVRQGLTSEVSTALVLQTFVGSARMLTESGEPPEILRARVTSPGGTTEAGISVLEGHGFTETLADAVAAASSRSRELGAEQTTKPKE